MKTHKTTFSD